MPVVLFVPLLLEVGGRRRRRTATARGSRLWDRVLRALGGILTVLYMLLVIG